MIDCILETPGDIIGAARACRDDWNIQPWFRGQSDADWPLCPKVARNDVVPQNQRYLYESGAANRFMRLAPSRHPNCPNVEDSPSWLFLMQHYGLPTRLLDWSESFLIAAYFATFSYKHWKSNGAIWALHPYRVNAAAVGTQTICTAHDHIGRTAADLAFVGNDIERMNPNMRDLANRLEEAVIALEPDEIDLRLLVQQSKFTVHGSRCTPNASAFAEGSIRRFVIPSRCKEDIAHALAASGLRQSNVFPDIEHLANEISTQSKLC